jgi:hypothetical protein
VAPQHDHDQRVEGVEEGIGRVQRENQAHGQHILVQLEVPAEAVVGEVAAVARLGLQKIPNIPSELVCPNPTVQLRHPPVGQRRENGECQSGDGDIEGRHIVVLGGQEDDALGTAEEQGVGQGGTDDEGEEAQGQKPLKGSHSI